jgi:alpha-tubulin suppressor-like RCC1 family protein
MNPLDQFLEEHSHLRADGEAKSADVQQSVEKSGTLLISGCVDWDNATSKTALGLDGPHTVDVGSPVIRTYSSSSSLHLFIQSSEGKLFGLGKNEHGQLSTGNTDTAYLPLEIHTPWPHSQLKKIATGRNHSLFLLFNGDVYGTGSNSCGQLGLGGGARDVQDSMQMKKLPLSDIRDVSCGYEHSIVCTNSGRVFTFGHPQYGALGHGATGEHLQEGKRGVQFNFVRSPEQVTHFMSSDGRTVVSGDEIRIRSVHAGKNHCVAVEEWVGEDGEDKIYNRVFSWGFGGYGRLGHKGATDELIPKEISTFVTDRLFPQKQVRHKVTEN